jgi:23S rRNA (guanosine2251-2'-O)-methyltransferase
VKRIVPGIHSVSEVFKIRPQAIAELWLREGDLNSELENFYRSATGRRIPVKRVSQKTLDRETQSHQGVIAMVTDAPAWPDRAKLSEISSGLILALDQLEDPHNVGSLVRSAWNLGAIGMITTKSHSPGGSPAAHKVASGGFEHIPILEASNLHSELMTLKDLGFWVYGLAEEGSQSLVKTDFASKAILVIGSEESGLRKPVVSACDAVVSIPQAPGASSFNAAIAGAIAGFEFVRQRALSETSDFSRKNL